MATKKQNGFVRGYNYLNPVSGTVKVIVRQYAAADETEKAELRLRNPDLDLDRLLEEMEKKVQ